MFRRRGGFFSPLRRHLLRAQPRIGARSKGCRQVPAQAQEARQGLHFRARVRPDAPLPVFLQVRRHPQL